MAGTRGGGRLQRGFRPARLVSATLATAMVLVPGASTPLPGRVGGPAKTIPAEVASPPADWEAARPSGDPDPPDEIDVPVPDLDAEPYSAPVAESQAAPAAEDAVVFPATTVWDLSIDLGSDDLAATGAQRVGVATGGAAEDPPVSVRLDLSDATRTVATALANPPSLRLEILDRNASQANGATGFLFRLGDPPYRDPAGPSGLLEAAVAAGQAIPAEITVDYSGFSGAYGADFGGRLVVRVVPACASVAPVPEGCEVVGQVPPQVNLGDSKITISVEDLARLWMEAAPAGPAETDTEQGAAVVFAVTSATGGEQGTFSASDLSLASQWQVGTGTGEFSWSHPIAVPVPGVGGSPDVSLSYTSSAVDGMTNATSTQGSTVGVGWGNTAEAFIERTYESCADDRLSHPSSDLCWPTFDRPVLSLGGVSGRLVQADSGEWRLEGNPDWRVERLTGANNGAEFGEHWRLTAADGTEYWFGLGRYGEANQATESVATVLVRHPFSGQPCYAPGELDFWSVCRMGWRWGLDRVVDPDGNLTVYFWNRHRNYYNPMNGVWKGEAYDRVLFLREIVFGARANAMQPTSHGLPTARVQFNYHNRCRALDATCDDKSPSLSQWASEYPDVPTDLVCVDSTGADSRCATSPSFFHTKRLASISTAFYHAGRWWPKEQVNVSHRFQLWDSNRQGQLSVAAIQRNGLMHGGWQVHEPSEFGYQQLQNRVDTATASMIRWRLQRVDNEFDGRIEVTYERPSPCPANFTTNRWDQNTRDCFPQHINDHGFTRTGAFNKYLVTEVREDPRVDGWGGPLMTTRYIYGEPLSADPTQEERHSKRAAWRFNEGSFGQDTHDFGWTNWRGYATVEIQKGGSCPNPGDCGAPVERTRIRVFRGMHGDRDIEFNPRSFSVPLMAGPNQEAGPVADVPVLAGRTLEEQRIGTVGGQPGQVAEARWYTYETREIEPPKTGRPNGIRWAAASVMLESVATAAGQWRQRQATTTYDEDRLPVAVAESGWLDVTGDERCTATTYASNPDRNLLGLPASSALHAGDCGTGQPLTYTETLYDGLPLGQVGEHGRVTSARTQIDADTFAETSTEYDSYGRVIRAIDAEGRSTTTTRTADPSHGIPYLVVVENELGHKTTTRVHPDHGGPMWVEDANGNRISYRYDAAGRLIHVWLADQDPESDWPAYVFQYDLRPAYRAIQSMRLGALGSDGSPVYESVWNIYDGFWRLHETQSQSPEAGHIVIKRVSYDTAGRVKADSVPAAIAAGPGRMVVGWSANNVTRYQFDDLGRQVSADWYRGESFAHSTVTEYGTDTVTVTGPDGGQARTTTDGLGRNIEVAEWDGEQWVAATYNYDLAGNLMTAVDPAGNAVINSYNMAGWLITRDDPDRGHAEYAYNLAGQQTSVTDALGKQVFSVFDQLGRTVETRLGSPDGHLVGEWEFDTAPGGIGMLAEKTSHTPLGEWVSRVDGYDQLGRPTAKTLTVPDGVPGVAGTYRVPGQVYDAMGRVIESIIPAVGGLPQETVTETYDNLGLHTASAGDMSYTREVAYDPTGRMTASYHGGTAADDFTSVERRYSYDIDQRPSSTVVLYGPHGSRATVYRSDLQFSDAGNLTSREVAQNGQAWRECYRYDARSRLTSAFSMDPGSECDTADLDTGEFRRGPQPFEERYAYTPDGRIGSRTTSLHPSWADIQTYVYPEQGGDADQPHAPIETGRILDEAPTTWEWDAAGNLVSRTEPDGTIESFAWDGLNRLASHTSPGGETTFTYAASGERLTRTTPDGTTTVYLLGHEVNVDAAGQVTQAARTYAFEGRLVAVRALDHTQLAVVDDAGSLIMGVDPASGVAATRSFNPYGDTREQAGDFGTDRGFLGKPEDTSTGLSYLDARYYDTEAALFTQADPLWSAGNVKSLNPYTYGFGNPTTFSDPTGLYSAHSFGLEMANWQLRYQNSILTGIIGQLEADISKLQGVVKDQAKQIRELIAYSHKLESYISKLESHVRYLEGVVVRQARYIAKLEATVAWQAARIRSLERQVVYWRGRAHYWRGQAIYYRDVVNVIGSRFYRTWGSGHEVYDSIHSGNGVPDGAFVRSTATICSQPACGAIDKMQAAARRGRDQHRIGDLRVQLEEMRFQRNYYYADAMMRHSPDRAALDTAIGFIPGVGDAWGVLMTLGEFLEGPPRGLAELPSVLVEDPELGADVMTGCPANEAWCFLEIFPDPPDRQTGLR